MFTFGGGNSDSNAVFPWFYLVFIELEWEIDLVSNSFNPAGNIEFLGDPSGDFVTLFVQ